MARKSNIHNAFHDQGNKAAVSVAGMVIKKKALLPQVLKGIESDNKRIKNAAAKTAKLLSEQKPEVLYADIDFFIHRLLTDDTILKWIAMDVVGNLATVDEKNKINKRVIDKLITLLSDESMITAGHSIDNLGKIAGSKPRFRQPITDSLIKSTRVKRDHECSNILAGKMIMAFSQYAESVKDKKKILAFVKRQLNSSRNATRSKASIFLRKYGPR